MWKSIGMKFFMFCRSGSTTMDLSKQWSMLLMLASTANETLNRLRQVRCCIDLVIFVYILVVYMDWIVVGGDFALFTR